MAAQLLTIYRLKSGLLTGCHGFQLFSKNSQSSDGVVDILYFCASGHFPGFESMIAILQPMQANGGR